MERHTHAEWQICEYLNAPGDYFHRGVDHHFAPGTFVVIPPNEVHGSIDSEIRLGAKYRVWYFNETDAFALNHEVSCALGPRSRPESVRTDSQLTSIMDRLSRANPDEHVEYAELLMAGATGTSPAMYAVAIARSVNESALVRARDYLRDHPGRAVPLHEVATAVDLSSSRLSHAFRTRFHMSPCAFGRSIRVDYARRLLLRGVSIAEAAAHAGFADQPHFTRSFRKYVGPTPRAYVRAARSFKT